MDKYLTAKNTTIPISPYAFPRDKFELSVGIGPRAWQRGVGHLRIGPPGVVGENINGTANVLMTNDEVIASAYSLCHTNNAPTERGGQRRDVELWRGDGM